PHPEVLVEVARPVVPPREPTRLLVTKPIGVHQTRPLERAERRALRLGDMGSAVDGGLVPDVLRRRGHVEVATQNDRLADVELPLDPPREPLEPRQLADVER